MEQEKYYSQAEEMRDIMKYAYVVYRKFVSDWYVEDIKVDSIHMSRKAAMDRKRMLVERNYYRKNSVNGTYHVRQGTVG